MPLKKIQIVLAGIGGQGILFSSRLFAEWGLKAGLAVMGSETHGMSQRGGSVAAHLKLGDFHSPMIRERTADILFSFERDETYKSLHLLRAGGACFANLADPGKFDKRVLDHLTANDIAFRSFDASGAALAIGSVKSTNIILIGYSIGTGLVPFEHEDLSSVLESITKRRFREINLRALETGYRAGKES
jgi:indolepyruvate ferredoxin oxidoreductase beta subunit